MNGLISSLTKQIRVIRFVLCTSVEPGKLEGMLDSSLCKQDQICLICSKMEVYHFDYILGFTLSW